MERRNAWKTYTEKELGHLEQIASDYKVFLDEGKTERECVSYFVKEAEKAGYRSIDSYIESGEQLKAGDKVYAVNMKKTMVMFQIGTGSLEKGLNILGAHIDSPRLDIKQNPLYEDTGFAYLDTHYYGGIKKYQWVAMPLAFHGVVAKKDGSVVDIVIGEDDNDPIVYITDLLPHLGARQLQKTADVVVEGEQLDILIGSRPLIEEDDKDAKEAVKANILKLLKEKYNFEEEDFLSAEIEVVPAGKSRDCGLDRSMIMGYGQDDRVCAYTSFLAMLEAPVTEKTSCCLLVDKEEVGSIGATGMESRFFENMVAEVMNCMGAYSELSLRRALTNSSMLSSDVSAAYDPMYTEPFEKKNTSYAGSGVVFIKYTGAKGKGGCNDANAEYLGKLRAIMEKHSVVYQTSELGKVDFGGGGTIAYILAGYGMNVIDCGVCVLSMHAPWEVTNKADIYEAYKCYKAFLAEA